MIEATNNPYVTVVVPSYNHAQYIKKCIMSIINQTYKNFQLIVIDDGSSDNSVDIIQDLSEMYGFTFIVQENKGVAATLNRAIREYCVGDYFTFCASDDFWTSDKLEIQVAFMEENRFYPMS